MVRNILVHGEINILMKVIKKDLDLSGLQEDIYIMGNLNRIKEMGLGL